jgi:hypothetical protein
MSASQFDYYSKVRSRSGSVGSSAARARTGSVGSHARVGGPRRATYDVALKSAWTEHLDPGST